MHAHLATVRAHEVVGVLLLAGTGTPFSSGVSLTQSESGGLTADMSEALAEDLSAVRVPSVCALAASASEGVRSSGRAATSATASPDLVWRFPRHA
ncbi:MAG: hypothetical protein FJ207_02230 [Gemmatimonadetes bacterium]|nr:hypothetical protein [Gemmatimonadota bacterium]